MDIPVATAADHKGFAAPLGHELYPCGSLTVARSVEVGELADVVYVEVLLGFADLTAFGEESVDDFVAPGTRHYW